MASSVCLKSRYSSIAFLNQRNLLGAQAHLAGLSAGIAHCENRKRMALPAGALLTSRGMMDGALEERAAEDAAG